MRDQARRLPNASEITTAAIRDLRTFSFGLGARNGIETFPVGGGGLQMAIRPTRNGSDIFLFADRAQSPGVVLPHPTEIGKLIDSALGSRRFLGKSDPTGPLNIDRNRVYVDENKNHYSGKHTTIAIDGRTGVLVTFREVTDSRDSLPTLYGHLHGEKGRCNWSELGNLMLRQMQISRPDLARRLEAGALRYVPDTEKVY